MKKHYTELCNKMIAKWKKERKNPQIENFVNKNGGIFIETKLNKLH